MYTFNFFKEFGTAFHNLVALTPNARPLLSISRLKPGQTKFKELFQLFRSLMSEFNTKRSLT